MNTYGRLKSRATKAMIRWGVLEEPREFLFRMLPPGSVGAEIGVWKGDFSSEIAARLSPAELHLVDPWAFVSDEGHTEAWYGGKVAKSQVDMDRIYEGVRSRFANQIEKGSVIILRLPSLDAVGLFSDSYFDWVYVDGDHTYEAALADLEAYAPKVRGPGLLLGDDYREGGRWQGGVKRAVDAFLATHPGWHPHVIRNRQFVLSRRV